MRRLGLLLLFAGGAAAGDPETEALLRELDAEIARRREGALGAEALAAEVLALRRRIADGAAEDPARPEAHVVVVREWAGEDVRVRVTARGAPVVLVLVGETSRWFVDRASGVDLRRVHTAASGRDVAVWVPPGTPLDRLRRVPPGFGESGTLGAAVEERVRCGVSTILEATPNAPVVVGPENPEWEAQRARTEARRLHWRATRERRTATREALKAFRFGALRRWPDPARRDGTLKVAFSEWTPLGPLLAKEIELAGPLAGATAAVKDDSRSDLYLLRHGILLKHSLPSGPPEVLRVPDTLPAARGSSALAIDTRRDRLLLATTDRLGYLYALDLKSGQWSVVNDLDGVDAAGMAYDAQRDAVLCVEYGEGNALRLQRFSPEDGRRHREIPLRAPRPRERRPLVAACDGGRLVLLMPPAAALAHRDAEESRVLVVEPHSGQVVYSGVTRPWQDFAPLDDAMLEDSWRTLLAPNEEQAAAAMRKLAGQGDRAVAFVARRLEPEPDAVEELGRHVAQLADDDAFVRDLALYRLVEAGAKAADFLVSLDRRDLPPEARRRIEAALEAVGGPSSVQRGLRAVRVLEWVESPAAKALLRELAAKGEPKRQEAAAEALARIDRPCP